MGLTQLQRKGRSNGQIVSVPVHKIKHAIDVSMLIVRAATGWNGTTGP